MSINDLKSLVRNYLISHSMFVEDEWLTGCIEYLIEDSSNNYNERDILNLAKEQWLLNDLKDICPGSLPPNLKQQQKILLTGRFVLQINAVLDIGTPAYQQYLKLQKVNTENIDVTTKFEEKISNHRMLKLYLTDGVQEVSAIEYRPMRNLTFDITPGCKVLIKGPVECRRGVMLLIENSVELLGGEVQEITESNSLAGLLSSKLGIPTSQDPTKINPVIQSRNTSVPTLHNQMPIVSNQSFGSSEHNNRPIARVTSVQVADFVDDDIDIDEIADLEAQINDHPGKRTLYQHSKPEKRQKMDPVIEINMADNYPDDNDFFLEEDEDHLKDMEAKFDANVNETNKYRDKRPIFSLVPADPFVFIKQINDMKECNKTGRVFRIKGQIMKLLSKLSVGKDGWSLKCTIVDGTGGIDVDFTSDVLSKLVGFTPQEMNHLKKEIVSKPELKEKAISALQKAKDTLQVLYCIIELTMLETPKITCLIPFEQSHINQLRKRMPNDEL